MSYTIILESIPLILKGLWLTVVITILSFLLGQIMALPIGLARASKSPFLYSIAFVYTSMIRGSPVIVQLFIVYFGLAQIPFIRESVFWFILRDPINCAILTVGLNSAAYVAELINGAIKNMQQGQFESAKALGLSKLQTLIYVILPQVYRAIIPALGNELTLVMKTSTLASAITVMEMTGISRSLVSKTYAPFEIFTIAGIFYLVIGVSFGMFFKWIETKFSIPGQTDDG